MKEFAMKIIRLHLNVKRFDFLSFLLIVFFSFLLFLYLSKFENIHIHVFQWICAVILSVIVLHFKIIKRKIMCWFKKKKKKKNNHSMTNGTQGVQGFFGTQGVQGQIQEIHVPFFPVKTIIYDQIGPQGSQKEYVDDNIANLKINYQPDKDSAYLSYINRYYSLLNFDLKIGDVFQISAPYEMVVVLEEVKILELKNNGIFKTPFSFVLWFKMSFIMDKHCFITGKSESFKIVRKLSDEEAKEYIKNYYKQ